VAAARPWERSLAEALAIEPVGADVFRAELDGFGGVTLGCATLAAACTAGGRSLHSLHAYFLRPVPAQQWVELAVERVRDGRRTAHRRVRIRHGERLLCELVASFTTPGEGAEYQDARVEAAPPPEDLPSEDEVARAEGWKRDEPGPLGGALEWRWIDGTPWSDPRPDTPSRYRAWVRSRGALAPDPPLQAAALAFLSDYHSHMSVARRLGGRFEPFGYTSLDQALWVHRDLAWDDWRLLVTESDVAHAGRALTRRALHTRDGRLVASMAQEQMIPGAAGD
jgi:acyl-CoA thioesterase-2